MQAKNTLSVTSDLVRRDSRLHGLELMFNPERLLERLGGHLDVDRVETIKLDYLRYKPGMNCLGRYQLQVDGRTISVHAKAHGPDASNKIGKSMERPVVDTILGPGRVVLQQENIVFSMFPNDAKLFSLQLLAQQESRQRLFGRVFGSESEWNYSQVDGVMNYKPERRYVVCLRKPDGDRALAKFYSKSGYARAHAISRQLNMSRNDFYPDILGRSKKYAVVAYRWQPGTTLRQLMIDGQISHADLCATAGSLAEFHSSDGRSLSLPDRAVQLDRLDQLAGQLGFLLPQLEQRARSVAQNLSRWLCDQKPVSEPVHGDFYDKQVVINEGEARLIDLDAACLGSPLLDLGNYIAHLESRAVGQDASSVDVDGQRETLVTTYERLTGGFSMTQLNAYVALGMFALTHHPFRDWVNDWPEKTDRLLSRVETLIEG